MKKIKLTIFAVTASFFLTSCASIVSRNVWPVAINSTPNGANILILNENGDEVYKGFTPTTVRLKGSNHFLKRAAYQVKFNREGFEEKIVTLNCKVNGWYWGNLLVGGIIGMLIIDPATGAMYKLEEPFLNERLKEIGTTSTEKSLNLYDINQIPNDWKEHLVKID